jgi:pilus assembly protein Flp/PilA
MMTYFMNLVQSLRDREEGQTLAEYALILALIAVLCVGALTALSSGIQNTLSGIVSQL